jgi:hypothetical protein
MLDVALLGGAVLALPVLLDSSMGFGRHPPALALCLLLLAVASFAVVGTANRLTSPQSTLVVAVLAAIAACLPVLGIDTVRVFVAVGPFFVAPVALSVAVIQRRLHALSVWPAESGPTEPSAAEPVDPLIPRSARSPGSWPPAVAGAALVGLVVIGTPLAMVAVRRPATPPRQCPDGRPAEALLGGVALGVVPDAADVALDEMRVTRYFTQVAGYLPFPGNEFVLVNPPTTVLAGLTVRGDDRYALVAGRVEAPERGATYLCGRASTDPATLLASSYFPQPIDFFRGGALGRRAITSE